LAGMKQNREQYNENNTSFVWHDVLLQLRLA
jgi:hypothetical protein